MDEKGYIQYHIDWEPAPPVDEAEVSQLIHWRQELHAAGLIGVDSNGLGYGNISERRSRGFMVSGTQTGNLSRLAPEHFVHVLEYEIGANWIRCRGPVKPSAEALSHAILYELAEDVLAVVHVHAPAAWRRLVDHYPTTDPSAEAGTVGMAEEIGKLYRESDLSSTKVLVMGGHEDGLMSFGRDLDEAGEAILRACRP
jgi:ribulose-5-phosphate 4-epimerase/fuculose-1-phosphate aldolase